MLFHFFLENFIEPAIHAGTDVRRDELPVVKQAEYRGGCRCGLCLFPSFQFDHFQRDIPIPGSFHE